MSESHPAAEVYRKNVLSVLIPVYNERPFLKRCLERVLAAELPAGLTKEIVLVDDGSTDGSDTVIRAFAAAQPDVVKAMFQKKNQGKGAAIRRALEVMTGEFVVFQDADLEYDPGEYAVLLRPILEGVADVVYGSRFASRTMRRVFNYHHALGNRFLTMLSNMTTGLDLTDMETCYKAFRAEVIKGIPIRSDRFGLEPEITSKIAKRGCSVYEVSISYRGRSYEEGKKIGWKDGLQALWTILKFWILDDCWHGRYQEAILSNLSTARRLNRWMVAVTAPYMGNRILEVGSGLGNISRYLPKKEKLVVTDVDPLYLELLRNAFVHNELVEVKKLDLADPSDFDAFNGETFDTVVCFNVLEHVERDQEALERLNGLLVPGGRLLLLVPQYAKLFGSYDRVAGHFRRYSKESLRTVVIASGLTVERQFDFNFLPILGWWVNSCLLQKTRMDRWQLKIFDTLVIFLKHLERLLPLPGISLICVARKPE